MPIERIEQTLVTFNFSGLSLFSLSCYFFPLPNFTKIGPFLSVRYFEIRYTSSTSTFSSNCWFNPYLFAYFSFFFLFNFPHSCCYYLSFLIRSRDTNQENRTNISRFQFFSSHEFLFLPLNSYVSPFPNFIKIGIFLSVRYFAIRSTLSMSIFSSHFRFNPYLLSSFFSFSFSISPTPVVIIFPL